MAHEYQIIESVYNANSERIDQYDQGIISWFYWTSSMLHTNHALQLNRTIKRFAVSNLMTG